MNDQPSSHHSHETEEDARNRDIRIWVNGDIVHRDDAKVSVYDSGFMLGDGMWEGMRLYDGKWAFFDEHMDRLFGSCKAVGIDIGMDRAAVLDALTQTAAANNMVTDAHCRLMVTRGIKDKPFQHPRLSRSGPTMVIIIEHSMPLLTSIADHLVALDSGRFVATGEPDEVLSHPQVVESYLGGREPT